MALGTVFVGRDMPQIGAEPIEGYRLLARLGEGGHGEVWRAEGPGGFHVALKFTPFAGSPTPREFRALEILRGIRHPNLLVTFGAWQIPGYLILGMELADRTLWDRFREATDQGLRGIPRDELLEYLNETAKGIDHLNDPKHTIGGRCGVGIQHCDLKPQNILLAGGGVKVGDFGLARSIDKSLEGHQGNHWTFAYAAPEFFRQQTSRHSDQYSLAATYCHLRGGSPPFRGPAASMMAGHLMLDPDLSMLPEPERPAVARALAKDPKQRWPTCRAFLEALSATPAVELPPPIFWGDPTEALDSADFAAEALPSVEFPPDAPTTINEVDPGSYSSLDEVAVDPAGWSDETLALIESYQAIPPGSPPSSTLGWGESADRPPAPPVSPSPSEDEEETLDEIPADPAEWITDVLPVPDFNDPRPAPEVAHSADPVAYTAPFPARPRRRRGSLALAGAASAVIVLAGGYGLWAAGVPLWPIEPRRIEGQGEEPVLDDTFSKHFVLKRPALTPLHSPAPDPEDKAEPSTAEDQAEPFDGTILGSLWTGPRPATTAVEGAAIDRGMETPPPAAETADVDTADAAVSKTVAKVAPPDEDAVIVAKETVVPPPPKTTAPVVKEKDEGPPLVAPVDENREIKAVRTPEPPASPPAIHVEVEKSLTVRPGEESRMPISVRRDYFQGEVTAHFEGLPRGVKIADVVVPEGVDKAEAHVKTAADAAPSSDSQSFKIVAKSKDKDVRDEAEILLNVLQSPAQKLVLQARKEFDGGRYDRSIGVLDEAIQLSPNDALPFSLRGSAHLRKWQRSRGGEDFKKAIEDFNRAIKLRPQDPTNYNNRGLAYRVRGEPSRAIADYSEAIRLQPANAVVWCNRGLAYQDRQDHRSAVADFTEAIKLDKKNALAFRARAESFAKQGREKDAEADRDWADRLDPASARPKSTPERSTSTLAPTSPPTPAASPAGQDPKVAPQPPTNKAAPKRNQGGLLRALAKRRQKS